MTRFFTPALSLLCAGALFGLGACSDDTTGTTGSGTMSPTYEAAPAQTPAGSGALDGTTGGTLGTGAPMDTLGMGGTGTLGTGGTGTMGTDGTGTGTNPIP